MFASVNRMPKVHPFLPNSPEEISKRMLEKIGVSSVEDLFEDIPRAVRLPQGLKMGDALTEAEVERRLEEILSRNMVPPDYLCFLGGGVWYHHIPAAVDEIISRAEFYTSYTPYQPEISQGMLQALFEYQSLICDLTGMQVANSSMYDWATAAGEAARMAMRINRRKKIVVSRNVGPDRLEAIKTYCYPIGASIELVDFDKETGGTSLEEVSKKMDGETAGIYLENPSFFGVIETEASEVADIARRHGALVIVGVDPISLGVLKPPGEYGADIVVGEGQPLGIPMNFGGPLIGIFASRDEPSLLRQMPGRIIGATTSKDNSRRGYTMILQAREQHIRREAATSNICTNEALLAVASSAYLSLVGPVGLREVGEACLTNSHLAARLLSEIDGLRSPRFAGPYFKDFAVSVKDDKQEARGVISGLLKQRVLAGPSLGPYFQELGDCFLLSCTEMHTESDIAQLADAMRKTLEGN